VKRFCPVPACEPLDQRRANAVEGRPVTVCVVTTLRRRNEPSVNHAGKPTLALKRVRGVEEDAAFERDGKVLRGAELDVADGLGFLDLVIHTDLGSVVSAVPDGEGDVAAEQRITGLPEAKGDELGRKRVFARGVGRKAEIAAWGDGVEREPAKSDAAGLATAGPDGGGPWVAVRAAGKKDRVGGERDGAGMDFPDDGAVFNVEVGAGGGEVRSGVADAAGRGGVDDAGADAGGAAGVGGDGAGD